MDGIGRDRQAWIDANGLGVPTKAEMGRSPVLADAAIVIHPPNDTTRRIQSEAKAWMSDVGAARTYSEFRQLAIAAIERDKNNGKQWIPAQGIGDAVERQIYKAWQVLIQGGLVHFVRAPPK